MDYNRLRLFYINKKKMTDQNNNTNQPQNPWEINLDNLGNIQSTPAPQETPVQNPQNNNSAQKWSIIWKLNAENWSYQWDADLRKIWNVISLNGERHQLLARSRNITLLVIAIILTSIAAFLFFKYDKYIIDYSNWIENTDHNISNLYENTKQKIYPMLWMTYEEPNTSIDISSDNWEANLNALIQNNKWYIYKKETLKNSMKDLVSSVIKNANRLDESKKRVSTYWFFSYKLANIISSDESIASIQDSLAAIEAIKFNSAFSVFSKLDTFIDSLSKEVKMDKNVILAHMDDISKRWEKDINLYLKNCYLNAFEIDYNCNNIWDFEKYYELTNDQDFDTAFFKKLIQFVDEKLEQTEIPSFSIKFRSFNKQSNELTFDIEINTFKEDERELARKWILSSHSFILNNLINNLKLSRAIVSEWIEVKSINVKQKTITIWMTEFTVNTSNKTFSVPVKWENQIEIDDFLY